MLEATTLFVQLMIGLEFEFDSVDTVSEFNAELAPVADIFEVQLVDLRNSVEGYKILVPQRVDVSVDRSLVLYP